ncbi:Butyrophilin subfamily 3 member A2 [Chelonia mydas]|uniref:Butyrophilin subfamily 3 member A2 n=1 Tax=Chelonia mydas TaxID=8469 RepID=M7BXD2_CHEMY|nr:Butyrophilin subfamily 3 member A2 [Chelonia mydas]
MNFLTEWDASERAVAPVFTDVLGPQGQGIGLACRSTGWFPKPELQWVGNKGQNLVLESKIGMTQDNENLYNVLGHVIVPGGEAPAEIICIVQNGLLKTEQQSAIHLAEAQKKELESEQHDQSKRIGKGWSSCQCPAVSPRATGTVVPGLLEQQPRVNPEATKAARQRADRWSSSPQPLDQRAQG